MDDTHRQRLDNIAAVLVDAFTEGAANASLSDIQARLQDATTNFLNSIDNLPSAQKYGLREAWRKQVLDRIKAATGAWRDALVDDHPVALHTQPICHLALACRLHPVTLELAHPGLTAPDEYVDTLQFYPSGSHDQSTTVALCPAVLIVLGLLPRTAVLDAASLSMVLRVIDQSRAHADALPHNWGFKQLLWRPGHPQVLSGRHALLFDDKHWRDCPSWIDQLDHRKSVEMDRAWARAATWTTVLAEYERQPGLKRDHWALYTQFWQAAQQSAGPALHTLYRQVTNAIKLGLFSGLKNAPHNISDVHALLDLRLSEK